LSLDRIIWYINFHNGNVRNFTTKTNIVTLSVLFSASKETECSQKEVRTVSYFCDNASMHCLSKKCVLVVLFHSFIKHDPIPNILHIFQCFFFWNTDWQ